MSLTFDEYQLAAASTKAGNPDLVVSALGLAGETGEFADHIKKWIAHGHPLNTEYLVKELGDILWYIANAADALTVDLDAIAKLNLDKLRERYPEGFTTERSLNRDE